MQEPDPLQAAVRSPRRGGGGRGIRRRLGSRRLDRRGRRGRRVGGGLGEGAAASATACVSPVETSSLPAPAVKAAPAQKSVTKSRVEASRFARGARRARVSSISKSAAAWAALLSTTTAPGTGAAGSTCFHTCSHESNTPAASSHHFFFMSVSPSRSLTARPRPQRNVVPIGRISGGPSPSGEGTRARFTRRRYSDRGLRAPMRRPWMTESRAPPHRSRGLPQRSPLQRARQRRTSAPTRAGSRPWATRSSVSAGSRTRSGTQPPRRAGTTRRRSASSCSTVSSPPSETAGSSLRSLPP